jgi:hypothetical protein
MWPLISHVELERINWTVGMAKLAKIILTFYAKKGLESITEDMIETNFTIKWSTSLPRDREALINELAIRKKNNMTSLKHILELLGDIEDVEREITEINKELDEQQKREMETMKAQAEARGNALGKNNQEPGDKTNKDAGQMSKESA